ncbi:MAG: M20/M25/M40 family metallo-hydrolase [Eggerthellaceae bacterium]
MHGKGGHGSRPHQLVDRSHRLPYLLRRAEPHRARARPNDQAVITFGAINGGTRQHRSDDVHLLGTLRTIDEGTRAHLKERMEAMCRGIAEGFGGSVDVRFLRGVPSVYNDPDLTDELIGYVEDLTGRPVTILDKPISGSDDMSVISQAVPTTYFVMGTGSEDEGVRYPVHNSRVVFDESVFVEGAAMTATMALRWLEARARDDKENER